MLNLRTVSFLLALAGVFLSANAFAITVEQRETTNSDGSSKFADPDDQTPALLTSPDGNGNSHVNGPLTNQTNGPSVQQMLGVGQGNDAFDHAFNHVTNQSR